MNIRSIAVLAALVAAPSAAFADAASDIVRIFGRDPGTESAHACFVRHYTKEHLASHPKQNVTDMLLLVTKQEGSDPHYELSMQVNFRQLKKPFEVFGGCSKGEDGKQVLSCGIDCDGGSLAVRVKNETSMLVDIPYNVRIFDPSASEDASEDDLPKGARFGEDDKLFRLDRASLKDCAPVISDEDFKAKVLQGVTTQ
jgi:hypothetical protein